MMKVNSKPLANEKDIQSLIVQEAAAKGCILWRNNVGCMSDKSNRLVRYGLANTSKKQNEDIKSADLIGIKRVLITEAMVGKTLGLFISREVKRSGWKFKGNSHELAQKRWADLINSMGGDAQIVNDVGSL